jgi:DnaA regulatory inactivator Hda
VQRQLTLDLGTPPPSTFDNFHIGANAELVARLRGLDAALMAGPIADRTFYVWGEPGNGRSHLLQALAYEAPPGHVRYLGPKSALAAFTFDPRVTIYAVDDCDSLSGAQQIALFNLFNEVRSYPGCALVATGNAPPMGLSVREDLRTRLGWGLVFHLAPLSDEGKAAILKLAARERGIALADDVPAYLLTHFRRDMPSLMGLLDALDRFSLEQKRAVTLPLLRTMLAKGVGELLGGANVPLEDELADEESTLPAAGDADETNVDSRPGDDQDSDGAAQAQPDAGDTPPAPAASAPGTPDTSAAAPDATQPYEAPKPPALQARDPLPVPFVKPTDNVEGELGAKYRHVVHKELGAELKGEVEADVSNEMTGELRGDLDPPAAAAPSATAGEAHGESPAASGTPPAAATPATNDEPSVADQENAQPQPESTPRPPTTSAPESPADPAAPTPPAGAGNGVPRFK